MVAGADATKIEQLFISSSYFNDEFISKFDINYQQVIGKLLLIFDAERRNVSRMFEFIELRSTLKDKFQHELVISMDPKTGDVGLLVLLFKPHFFHFKLLFSEVAPKRVDYSQCEIPQVLLSSLVKQYSKLEDNELLKLETRLASVFDRSLNHFTLRKLATEGRAAVTITVASGTKTESFSAGVIDDLDGIESAISAHLSQHQTETIENLLTENWRKEAFQLFGAHSELERLTGRYISQHQLRFTKIRTVNKDEILSGQDLSAPVEPMQLFSKVNEHLKSNHDFLILAKSTSTFVIDSRQKEESRSARACSPAIFRVYATESKQFVIEVVYLIGKASTHCILASMKPKFINECKFNYSLN
ncbi:MAG: hypothetical protein ACPGUD_00450 [Parashewanella sp.]